MNLSIFGRRNRTPRWDEKWLSEIEKNLPKGRKLKILDAEKPEFPDATFDVVVSRNLTWTLPHAEEAYREWTRVLKKGGSS